MASSLRHGIQQQKMGSVLICLLVCYQHTDHPSDRVAAVGQQASHCDCVWHSWWHWVLLLLLLLLLLYRTHAPTTQTTFITLCNVTAASTGARVARDHGSGGRPSAIHILFFCSNGIAFFTVGAIRTKDELCETFHRSVLGITRTASQTLNVSPLYMDSTIHQVAYPSMLPLDQSTR